MLATETYINYSIFIGGISSSDLHLKTKTLKVTSVPEHRGFDPSYIKREEGDA